MNIEAQRMLEVLASARVTRFDMTWTNAGGEKTNSGVACRLPILGAPLHAIVDYATCQQRNVIVRPHGPRVTFISA